MPRAQPAGGGTPPPPSVTVTAAAPEPDPPRQPYRPRITHLPSYLASRFGAFVIDVFGVAFLLATIGYHEIASGAWTFVKADAAGFWWIATGAFSIALLIAFVSEGLFATTLGKLLFGLVVLNANGGYAGLGRALTRSAMRPIDLLLVGPIFALITPRRQRLGDLMAGTVVSQTRFAPLMSLVAGVVIGALVYAQFAFFGGSTSALAVIAHSLAAGTDLTARYRATEAILPVASPSPLESGAAATAAPAATDEASPIVTGAPGVETPAVAPPTPPASPAAESPAPQTPAPVMTT